MFWRRRSQREQDLERELRAHLDLEAEERQAGGLSPRESRLAARRALGNTGMLQEEVRDVWRNRWLEDFFKDIRFSLRQFRKAPGFTAVAVLSLALGIGANAAIFTLINGALLKSLPVGDPGDLVVLGDARSVGGVVGQTGSFALYSYDLYKYLRTSGVFEGLCAFQSNSTRVGVRADGSRDLQPAVIKLVSGNYFQVLGVNAARGRTILPADDKPSAPPVAVASFRYWKEILHADPSAIGSATDVSGVPVVIVGVAPPGFYGETLEPDPPSLWIPISVDRQLNPLGTLIDVPEVHWLYLMGRLKPGISTSQARVRLTSSLQTWLMAREGSRISAERRLDIAKSYIELTPGGSGITHMQQAYRYAFQLLLGIAAAVLLITCANLANLLLARGAARRAETAVRFALGASRGRLLRQMLTGSLTLALGGAALGLIAASFGARVLLLLFFHGVDYVPIRTTPDPRVLAFTLALSCAAALLFGLLPALRVGGEIARDMKGAAPGAKSLSRSHQRLGRTLIIAEIALSVVVLAGAGSFVRSLANLTNQHYGFDQEHVLTVNIDPGRAGYTYERLAPLYRQLQSRLNSLPGVKSASWSYDSPFNECCWSFSIAVEGYPPKREDHSQFDRVSTRYFETLGTRVLLGRIFDEHDASAARPVAVVTQEFVRRYLPGTNPIGRHFGIGGMQHAGDFEIVGVVEDAKYGNPRSEPAPMAFFPLLEVIPGTNPSSTGYKANFINVIEVRYSGSPPHIAAEVRESLAQIDPNIPVLAVLTMSDQVARMLSRENTIAVLAAFFGLLALVLTCIGLYGLTAYAAARRTSEIGIRIALGARRETVIAMMLRDVLFQCFIGLLIGVPGAFTAIRLVASQLYGVKPADPASSAGAAAILILCLAFAGYLPAWRASRLDPIRALRHE